MSEKFELVANVNHLFRETGCDPGNCACPLTYNQIKKIRAHKVNKKKRKEKTVLVWTFINFQKFKLQNMH
jgi:hypothetical protein